MKTIATGPPTGSLEVPLVAVAEVQELPAAVVVVVAAVLPLAERAGVLAVLQGKLSNPFEHFITSFLFRSSNPEVIMSLS